MKCITHTLTMMLVLVLGFLVGARYQRVLDNVEGLQTLTAVQKNRISELNTSNEHLASVVRRFWRRTGSTSPAPTSMRWPRRWSRSAASTESAPT